VFENVPGIASFQKGAVIKTLIEELEKKNYTISSKIVDATDYGVPQYRKRFILVANRLNIDFQFPDSQIEKITVQEAIGDLPPLQNGDKFERLEYNKNYISKYIQTMRKKSQFSYQNYVSRNKDYVIERYNYIKQGENWSAIPKHLMKNYTDRNKCHSGVYRRLKYSEPSVVISNYRKNMLIHPTENRGLSVREAARLQSFPDSYIFFGKITEIQQQIGNAVPPLLAEAIFKRIVKYSE
jgi:DNA (cytosine-5)-methyltransferase 1